MDEYIKTCLEILGFSNTKSLPKLKLIRKNYIKLLIEKHPDKNEGIDRGFNELQKAFEVVSKYIVENVVDDSVDEEESMARKEFFDMNIVQINKFSVTIKPPTFHEQAWETVLQNHYGNPDDKSVSGNGKKYSATSGVFITAFYKPKDRLSTLYIQGQSGYLTFVKETLPKLYQEVQLLIPEEISLAEEAEPARKRKRASKPSLLKECDQCPKVITTRAELRSHKLRKHTLEFDIRQDKRRKLPLSTRSVMQITHLEMSLKKTVRNEVSKKMSEIMSESIPPINTLREFDVKDVPAEESTEGEDYCETVDDKNAADGQKENEKVVEVPLTGQDLPRDPQLHHLAVPLPQPPQANPQLRPQVLPDISAAPRDSCPPCFQGSIGQLPQVVDSNLYLINAQNANHNIYEVPTDSTAAEDPSDDNQRQLNAILCENLSITEVSVSEEEARMLQTREQNNCDECGRHFENREGLNTHVKDEHASSENKSVATVYNCVKFPLIFSELNQLNTHCSEQHTERHENRPLVIIRQKDLIETNEPAKEKQTELCISCGECGKTFNLMVDFNNHTTECYNSMPTEVERNSEHVEVDNKSDANISTNNPTDMAVSEFNCDNCDFETDFVTHFYDHMLRVHGKGPFDEPANLTPGHFFLNVLASQQDELLEKTSSIESHFREQIQQMREGFRIMYEEIQASKDHLTKKVKEQEDRIKDLVNKVEKSPTFKQPLKPEKVASTKPSQKIVKQMDKNNAHDNSISDASKPVFKSSPVSKMLYVSDSVAANVDIPKLERESNSEITCLRAYGAAFKNDARYPRNNFTDTVTEAISKEQFDVILLSAPSVDVTDLDTAKNPDVVRLYAEQVAVVSAENMFQVATKALKHNSATSKVILMGHLPRYDLKEADPKGIKMMMTKSYSNTLLQLRKRSPLRQKIFVGSHHKLECSGKTFHARYTRLEDNYCDGIHLYGEDGKKALTCNILNMLEHFAVVLSHKTECPTAVYQREMSEWRLSAKQRRQTSITGRRADRQLGRAGDQQLGRAGDQQTVSHQQTGEGQASERWGQTGGNLSFKKRGDKHGYNVVISNRFSSHAKNGF